MVGPVGSMLNFRLPSELLQAMAESLTLWGERPSTVPVGCVRDIYFLFGADSAPAVTSLLLLRWVLFGADSAPAVTSLLLL